MQRFEHIPFNLYEHDELQSTTIDGKRQYVTPDGSFPSITTILGKRKSKAIQKWRDRVGAEEAQKITTKASRRGTNMHKVVENYLTNHDAYDDKALPHVLELFTTIKPIIDDAVSLIHGIEVPLWSKHLGVAGRCDCVALWNDKLTIVDWKTSNKPKKEEWMEDYFLQATAYSIMYEERTKRPVGEAVIVIAVEGDAPQVYQTKTSKYWKKLEDVIQEYA
jgi:genome maintenance exonuclease 1